jgi:putative membrane protein
MNLFQKQNGHGHGAGMIESLGAIRSRLANERTLLAYIRTALTFIIAGVTFIRFFNNFYIELLGYIFLPFGLVNLVLGIYRYRKMRDHIVELDEQIEMRKKGITTMNDNAEG